MVDSMHKQFEVVMPRDRAIREYSHSLADSPEEFLNWLLHFNKVGDQGSGSGNFGKEIAELVKLGANLPTIVNIEYQPQPDDVGVDASGKIQLADESLDAMIAVYSAGYYVDVENPISYLTQQFAEVSRVLRPGGQYRLNVLPDTINEPMKSYPTVRDTPDTEKDALRAREFHFFSPDRKKWVTGIDLYPIFEENGLSVIEAKSVAIPTIFRAYESRYGLALLLEKKKKPTLMNLLRKRLSRSR
jgi:hypothetical protein